MNNRRSFITGIKTIKLLRNEKIFLKRYKPWGVILFSRNIQNINQTLKLTKSIRKLFHDNNYPILIDQEGGKINRFKNLISFENLTSEFFGKKFQNDPKDFDFIYRLFINKTSSLLRSVGININTVPVLDLRVKGCSNVIGSRSFGENPRVVSKLGDFCIKHFHKNNIGTVIKHIPGHGLAKVDSHHKLPIIDKDLKYLKKYDFFPFTKKKSVLGMTGHLLFKKLDPLNNVSHSKKIIKMIRREISFKGILMSDDISMGALKGNLKNNVVKSFRAGCNLVLHCNGKMSEMNVVGQNSPYIDDFIVKKTSKLIQIIS